MWKIQDFWNDKKTEIYSPTNLEQTNSGNACNFLIQDLSSCRLLSTRRTANLNSVYKEM